MEPFLGQLGFGLTLGLATVGSALGIGAAGRAAAGAWAKEAKAGKPLNFSYIILTGMPQGVILGREPKVWLQPGDEVTVEVGPLGRLTNVMGRGTDR